MARHLAVPRFSLTVWNRTASRAEEFAEANGCRSARSPADAARSARVIVTCLPDSPEVEQVVFGEEGILLGAARGAVLVDCTSGRPAASRSMASRLAAAGISFLDAPVSGGVSGAEAGALTVMCGGTSETLESVRPVLEAFGRTIVLCGPTGAGHALKAVNNALLATHIWSTAEGLLAARSAGVDPAVALQVINRSSGRSNTSEHLFPERVLSGAFPRTFRLALLDKDVRIAAGLAAEAGTPSDVLSLVARLFASAHYRLGEEADHVEAVRVLEAESGLTIRG
jgi:3-hydroxyisobutyrate dehydrogenase